ncbi:hypothetical protein HanHA300_Chr11g0416411 [Helianthus annuus]|nr:hypothetical protein HanHA300_Chr11g0416411 [Helianthus annuus]KAJ0518705.1 hypothetical protein HanHA89_Chr11g0440451 [Helianthus annuus]
MSSVPSSTEPVWYRKSPKVGTGTQYTRFGTVRYGSVPVPVRYRYLRLKTGKYRYQTGTVPDRYRTRPVAKMLKVGTKKVPGSVPVPGTICSSLYIGVCVYICIIYICVYICVYTCLYMYVYVCMYKYILIIN